MKNYQNKRTAHQRLVPSERCRLAEDTALKRGPHVRKLRKMVNSNREDWKALARKAAHEQDPKKLLSIVEELNKALEERENQLRGVSRRIATKREGGNELLFVDDEPSIRLTLPPILQQRGFQVQIAASVSEARTAIKAHKFDVLLSDINIERESDGFTVVHAMREANPDCVTVLLTAYPAFETAVRTIRAEVDDYFTKPADLDAMISTIDRKLLARGMQRTAQTKKATPQT